MSKERQPLPQPLSLKEVTRLAKETALRDGYHAPMLIVDGSRQGIIGQLRELGGTFEERARQMKSVGYSVGQTGNIGELKQIFFVSEAWMSVGHDGQPPMNKPSQDPQRMEVLIVTHLKVVEHLAAMLAFEMIRSGEKLVALKEVPDFDTAHGHAESPLLVAFVAGFQLGTRVSES